MKKGYWIVSLAITEQEGYLAYVAANKEPLEAYGAKFLARAGEYTAAEGEARARNTIVEFPSYQAAVDCWNSEAYQAAKACREGAVEISLVIVEGVE